MTQKERKELCEKDFEKIDDTEFDFSDISEAVPVNIEDKENFDNISEEDKKKMKDDNLITNEEISDFLEDIGKS